MTLTVAGLENEVIGRIQGRMAYVGFSTTASGSNPNLQGPIRRAVRFLGIEPADALTVVDADLATVAGWQVEQVADLATLQALKAVLGQLTDFNVMVGNDQEDYADVAAQIRQQILDLEAVVTKPYGPALPTPSSGNVLPHHHIQGGSEALRPIHHYGRPGVFSFNIF